MLEIMFSTEIGILSTVTIAFIFGMIGYFIWKFAKLSHNNNATWDE